MTSSSQLQQAPGEWIQWFRQQLDRADKDMQVFIETQTQKSKLESSKTHMPYESKNGPWVVEVY